jgi:hydrogenase nickel incorporation protein HypA/HybF
MHELAVCQALLAEVDAIAQQNAAQVTAIRIAIGPLSGVEPHLLQQAYSLARAGTAANDAMLVIEEPPVRVRCRSCGAETNALPNRLICGDCGDWHTELTSGDELTLLRVEMNTAAASESVAHV